MSQLPQPAQIHTSKSSQTSQPNLAAEKLSEKEDRRKFFPVPPEAATNFRPAVGNELFELAMRLSAQRKAKSNEAHVNAKSGSKPETSYLKQSKSQNHMGNASQDMRKINHITSEEIPSEKEDPQSVAHKRIGEEDLEKEELISESKKERSGSKQSKKRKEDKPNLSHGIDSRKSNGNDVNTFQGQEKKGRTEANSQGKIQESKDVDMVEDRNEHELVYQISEGNQSQNGILQGFPALFNPSRGVRRFPKQDRLSSTEFSLSQRPNFNLQFGSSLPSSSKSDKKKADSQSLQETNQKRSRNKTVGEQSQNKSSSLTKGKGDELEKSPPNSTHEGKLTGLQEGENAPDPPKNIKDLAREPVTLSPEAIFRQHDDSGDRETHSPGSAMIEPTMHAFQSLMGTRNDVGALKEPQTIENAHNKSQGDSLLILVYQPPQLIQSILKVAHDCFLYTVKSYS